MLNRSSFIDVACLSANGWHHWNHSFAGRTYSSPRFCTRSLAYDLLLLREGVQMSCQSGVFGKPAMWLVDFKGSCEVTDDQTRSTIVFGECGEHRQITHDHPYASYQEPRSNRGSVTFCHPRGGRLSCRYWRHVQRTSRKRPRVRVCRLCRICTRSS